MTAMVYLRRYLRKKRLKMIDASLFEIDSVAKLRDYLDRNDVNWGQLEKHRQKFAGSNIFNLLDSAKGATNGEKAYRLLNPGITCQCGNDVVFYNWKRGFSQFCSKDCANNRDYTSSVAKMQATMLKRYGAKTTLESSLLREKVEQTNIDKYGSAVARKNKEVSDKIASTMLERYGTTIPYKVPEIAKKGGQTKSANSWKARISSNSNLYEFVSADSNTENNTWKCLSCESVFTHNWSTTQRNPVCRKCVPMIKGTSKFEVEIASFISEFNSIELNKRFYFGEEKKYYELDIFVPEKNIAVEFNGLYWHSELAGKDKNYHQEKRNFFHDKGIRIIFIFEHEWMFKRSICESIIKNALSKNEQRIYARKCKVIEVDKNTAKSFLENNHIAGYADSSINLALFYEAQMVALATFRKDRFGRDKSIFELIRFCSIKNSNVVGGLSKLLNYFQTKYNYPVKTFCDLRTGTGQSYESTGFIKLYTTSPGYWYFTPDLKVYHRSVFQKKKLLSLLNLKEDGRAEWDLALMAGLNRFWDCGHAVYFKDNK